MLQQGEHHPGRMKAHGLPILVFQVMVREDVLVAIDEGIHLINCFQSLLQDYLFQERQIYLVFLPQNG